MNNIVLVCDDKNIIEDLKSNLMLLRKLDFVFSCDFLSSEKIISQNLPQLVIIYAKSGDERVFNLIKCINNVPVFFITDEINDDYILNLYESGVSDYITTNQSKTELLIRVMSCLKKSVEIKKYERNTDLLAQIGILTKNTEFYSKKYTPAVFKSIIKKYLAKETPIAIMALAPDIEIKNRCSLEFLASIAKQNLREEDMIGLRNDRLHILLPNTNLQGALDVYNKIKKIIEDSCSVSAGILKIERNMTYDNISKNVDEALNDALELKNSAVVQENTDCTPAMNWLDKSNKKHKNFKLFKKIFTKKLEKVITPVFYQKQQIAEQRLFETQVEQYSNETKSRFSLAKDNKCSLLEITYPGAVKINIDIYKNINADTTPDRMSFELSQLDEKMLGDILDKFIRNFQSEDK